MGIAIDESRRATPRSAKVFGRAINAHLPSRVLLNTSVVRTGKFPIKKL